MNASAIREAIQRLHDLQEADEHLNQAIQRLHDLQEADERLNALLQQRAHLTKTIETISFLLHELLEAEDFQHALARIDFEDDFYRFIRATSGDTIVVHPPNQLSRWMKEVHARLYGLHIPELNAEVEDIYQKYLEELCAIDGDRRLMILWEREQKGTTYGGFPLSSFERGIGHVFIQADARHEFLYVNGLMQLFRHTSSLQNDRSLLRGAHRVKALLR